ncbi:ABC transporter substrate-binding protein [Leeuwenhoekiella marinoflava]|uniref:Iron complex transport system substrate-binding protein n=2 Tax=Leeuwenhoekiella marinoflava TaxID=988 RepID=A0A4Q0PM50_9FLAO|nr:ABC transporter substrate-binding protein [Leeuwenhoekiella marinoflava]RXG30800.1 iron complex transport system substrate-binding protein [Leeuwenhoekiella marinoflava]SHF16058.1 iron complex transport system substrate-binding protein [Leeuwenhoekiella marinoflava DSM 3653]
MIKNLFTTVFLISFLVFNSCKNESKTEALDTEQTSKSQVEFATGFDIIGYDAYKILSVSQAWPGSTKTFRYALLKEGQNLPDSIEADATITIPITSIVVTSTTHIPALELLGVEKTLKGFPNLDYISSPKTRALINAEKIEELGQNESINTERTIDLNPDVVVSFGVEGENKSLNSLQRANIPILYNGDWTETSPLGQAEWIKFFAALYDKEKLADSIFNAIKDNYNSLKKEALKAEEKPTVLSGAMFKDVWYLPKGESWAAQLVADANAEYLYKDTKGTGSLSLSIESVLDKAQNAEFWIAPNAFESYQSLEETNDAYTQFAAFKNRAIYSFAAAKGETGGMLYYELAPSRPDWVLEDLVTIFHPKLNSDKAPHFFTPLE